MQLAHALCSQLPNQERLGYISLTVSSSGLSSVSQAVEPAVGLGVGKTRCVVPPDVTGQRLDVALAQLATATRSQIKILIDGHRVWVNGELAKAGRIIKAGEILEFLPLPSLPTAVEPQDLPLDILFEDEHLVAINKPPGMVVHPAPGQWDGTVVNALLFRWGRWDEQDHSLRPGIVHRLDKDTSGVLVIAKNLPTLEKLSRAFKERRVQKTYLAVTLGHFRSTSGIIDFPIGRHAVDRKKMAVRHVGGREAVTRYQVIEESQGLSLVQLFPATGRTHQLRVHLAAIGHPIVGDKTYGGQNVGMSRFPLSVQAFDRQALHARQIACLHPISGAPLSIYAPYPSDFLQLLNVFHESSL